jgi:hypothetical protein
MSKIYRKFNTEELIEYTKNFKFTRVVNQVHIHHTYLPNHTMFKGNNHDLMNWGMENYHTKTKGWSDIAQNLTLFPDGVWLLGRDFNKTPASILGWNTGALCIEMVGDFDKGKDTLEKLQASSVFQYCEFLIEEMGLKLKFHREHPNAGNSCPGTSLDRNKFIDEVLNFTENELAKKKVITTLDTVYSPFTDMIGENNKAHWSNDYVNLLHELRIMKGYPDGTFKPDEFVRRSEVSVIIAKTIESLEEKIMTKIKEEFILVKKENS